MREYWMLLLVSRSAMLTRLYGYWYVYRFLLFSLGGKLAVLLHACIYAIPFT